VIIASLFLLSKQHC